MFGLLLVFNGMDVWEWLDLLLVIQWNEWMNGWMDEWMNEWSLREEVYNQMLIF